LIGATIRKIRNEKGMTLKELADKIDITPGYISQIERDLTEPSLTILKKIAAQLGVTLTTLLSENSREGVVHIPLEKRTKIKFPDINMEYEFLTPSSIYKNLATNMVVIFFKLAPKSWGSNEIMLHDSDECVVVTQGTLEFHANDEVYIIKEGGSIYVPSNTPHNFYNPHEHNEVQAYGFLSPPI